MRFPYIPQGDVCDQHPNFLEPRGCGLQASSITNLGDFASNAYIAPAIRIEGVRPPINRVINPCRSPAAALHDVVPSTSLVARRWVTLSHTFWAWGQSHRQCLRVSIGEWQSGQPNGPPHLPSHSPTGTTLWPICHQKNFIFSGMWRRQRPFQKVMSTSSGMPNVRQPLRKGPSSCSWKVWPSLVLYSKKWRNLPSCFHLKSPGSHSSSTRGRQPYTHISYIISTPYWICLNYV